MSTDILFFPKAKIPFAATNSLAQTCSHMAQTFSHMTKGLGHLAKGL